MEIDLSGKEGLLSQAQGVVEEGWKGRMETALTHQTGEV